MQHSHAHAQLPIGKYGEHHGILAGEGPASQNDGIPDGRLLHGNRPRVARPPVTEDLARLTSYTEEMEARGLSVKTRVLDTGKHVPNDTVREKLKLETGQETVFVRRLRGTTDQFPVLLVETELPAYLGITPDEDFTDSLYRMMESKHRISIAGAIDTLDAAKATSEQAQLLSIAKGDCVLVLEELAYAPDGRPLSFSTGIYRADRYRFSINVRR